MHGCAWQIDFLLPYTVLLDLLYCRDKGDVCVYAVRLPILAPACSAAALYL